MQTQTINYVCKQCNKECTKEVAVPVTCGSECRLLLLAATRRATKGLKKNQPHITMENQPSHDLAGEPAPEVPVEPTPEVPSENVTPQENGEQNPGSENTTPDNPGQDTPGENPVESAPEATGDTPAV